MNKTLFVILNIVYFAYNFCVIPLLPNPILFGWMSLHYLLFFGSAIIASVFWASYFIPFFKNQKDL